MRKVIKDQVIGKTQAAGVKPSTQGIASKRIATAITSAVQRGIDCADAIQTLITARDSGDPASREIAARLLENKTFISAMAKAVESILQDVKGAAATQAPKADEGQHGPDYPESELAAPNNREPRPGMDGGYSKAQLLKDLEIQGSTQAVLARSVGLDAARARVANSPLIPAWDSPSWSLEAREEFRKRSLYDGFAAAHIAKAGDMIHMNDNQASDETEKIMRRMGAVPLDAPQPHPRSFDR